ncbi:MAG: hypothetical protein IPH78_05795 [Bacteroidetes bacterium]|nr:hypothetical protein [Bacteroidota bacterium]
MNTNRIDIANMILMVFACVAAFVLPFEVFLFSYAVLGPLHYLTEISWLHQRNYFALGKWDYVPFILIGILLFLFSFVFKEYATFTTTLIFISFFYALGTVLLKDVFYKVALVAVALFLGALLQRNMPFVYLFGVFLPTLIHVFLFTGLFILYGALKNKSRTGYGSLVIFVLCAISFFVVQPQFSFYQVSSYAEKALMESGFVQLNKSLIELFKLGQYTRETVFESAAGLGIMRFIAFAYTYHYLNWFSKTQVIQWHRVPKKQLATVLFLWLFSVALYAYNYYYGLVALYFLSMLHVLLEFPLNYQSFIGIGKELRAIGGGAGIGK